MFAGGSFGSTNSATIDIYNMTSNSWTNATLSQARHGLVAITIGNLAFFAGGNDGVAFLDRVDIYNLTSNSWSTANLSLPRNFLAATKVGPLVMFAGGYNNSASNQVDIYNTTSNMWSTAILSAPRTNLAAASVGDQLAIFAGNKIKYFLFQCFLSVIHVKIHHLYLLDTLLTLCLHMISLQVEMMVRSPQIEWISTTSPPTNGAPPISPKHVTLSLQPLWAIISPCSWGDPRPPTPQLQLISMLIVPRLCSVVSRRTLPNVHHPPPLHLHLPPHLLHPLESIHQLPLHSLSKALLPQYWQLVLVCTVCSNVD